MATNDIVDTVPYWTEKMYKPGGGQDHLGLGFLGHEPAWPAWKAGHCRATDQVIKQGLVWQLEGVNAIKPVDAAFPTAASARRVSFFNTCMLERVVVCFDVSILRRVVRCRCGCRR